MLTDLSVKEYLAVTAGSDPVPGGGSASALLGALAASLAKMVTGLTIGRKKYADVEDDMRLVAERLAVAAADLTAQVDADADAYNSVFAAFKLPKDTDEQKAARAAAIQAATVTAIEVPLRTAQLVDGILDDIRYVADHGNRNAVTDATVAMMSARTAILGAILNVRINLPGLDDKEAAENYRQECLGLESRAIVTEQSLLDGLQL